MTKSKRNLLVSVLVLILTVAIAGGSTYAWFTTNLKVKVDPIDINVTTGSKGLYVSTKQDTGFKTYLSIDDLKAANFDPATMKLNAVSSTDGITMKQKGTTPGSVDSAASATDYYDFAVYFRATGSTKAEGAPTIYLSTLSMAKKGENKQKFYNGLNRVIDAGVYGKTSGTLSYAKDAQIDTDAAHAARMSFQSEPYADGVGYKTAIDTPATLGNTGTTIRVWDPYKENVTTFRGSGTATTVAPTVATDATADWNKVPASNFALQYFDELALIQAGTGTLPDYTNNKITLPNTQMGAATFDGVKASVAATTAFNNDVLRLDWNTTTEAYEGKLIVRIWIEGYDGDCNNAILGDAITTNMIFTIFQTPTP